MAFDYISEITEKYAKQYDLCSSSEKCSSYSKESIMLPMRDDVCLHTLIFKPDMHQDKYPVVLMRTCYPEQDRVYRLHGEKMAKHGYVFVYQYSRGRELSEGDWVPNVNERQDGIDTVNWLYEQKWCETIGYWGYSYTGLAGWAMADAVQEKVSSMLLMHYGTDRFTSAYEKGSFRHDILTSWSMENTKKTTDASYPDYIRSCRYMPQSEADEKLWGERSETYREYIKNTRITDPYWQQGWWKELREIPEHINIPVYIISGWYDHHHASTMKTWERLSPQAKEHSWLEIGGWNHFMLPCLPDKKTEHLELEEIPRVLDWFQRTLVQKELPEKKIRIYRIGEDTWETISDKSQTKPEKTVYYLSGSNTASYKNPGCLTKKAGRDVSCFSYHYDPENPAETVSGEGLFKTMWKIGSLPCPKVNYRPDILSFVSDPIQHKLSICGKIRVKLFVRSDCEDTAFTARVMEIDDKGQAYHIRSSITTIGYELSDGADYVPGDILEVHIDMWEIAYTIQEGSRLRVDISSSDFPQFHIHSNYKGLWSEQTRTRTAFQTIFSGAPYLSCVEFPVCPDNNSL